MGAGASKEVNLPTGNELKNNIKGLLDIKFNGYDQIKGSHNITEALRIVTKNYDINDYVYAARVIYDGVTQAISIDNYLDAQVANELATFLIVTSMIRLTFA